MKNIEEEIQELLENAGHGTREEDVKAVWNAAIRRAAEVVRANYDPLEPWLEVSDIEDLYI